MKNELQILSGDLGERFANSIVVKELVKLVPLVGPLLSDVLSNAGNQLILDRIEDFLNMLNNEVKSLKSSSESLKRVESEEFYDLFTVALDSSIQDRSRERRIMNAKLLSAALRGEETDEFVEEFLYSIRNLSPFEIKSLATIYRAFTYTERISENDIEFSQKTKWREELIDTCNIEENDISFIVKRLETSGLISEVTGSYIGYAGGEIKINSSFEKLIEQLRF